MTGHNCAVHVAVIFVVGLRGIRLANVERQRRRHGVVELVPKHRVGPEQAPVRAHVVAQDGVGFDGHGPVADHEHQFPVLVAQQQLVGGPEIGLLPVGFDKAVAE
ncbi:hypothetical protein T12_12544 [Trichinella patagoniensis]|uniref:Uncharacterized protein n=1 Tax=Trichinella patagoniensis TaxID=990121 RepID=A0A0V0ZU04_9BILA|nr:beta-lactamase [Trichinella spiralis]KRY15772.1 hypothetical protein T12_12544 [Trichinella patagoniensis]